MNDKKKLTIFGVIVALIVVITVVIILVMNGTKKPVDNPGNNDVSNEIQGPEVNPDASPDDKPSIGGTDNVEINNGVKVNVSEKIKETVTYKDFTFTGISISFQNGETTLTAKVTSNSTTKVPGETAKIKFYDKSGKYISAMGIYIPQVKPGEASDLVATSTSDVTNAYSLEIVAE